jgi:hypothetical protein
MKSPRGVLVDLLWWWGGRSKSPMGPFEEMRVARGTRDNTILTGMRLFSGAVTVGEPDLSSVSEIHIATVTVRQLPSRGPAPTQFFTCPTCSPEQERRPRMMCDPDLRYDRALAASGSVLAPGHNSVVEDNGISYIFYHGMTAARVARGDYARCVGRGLKGLSASLGPLEVHFGLTMIRAVLMLRRRFKRVESVLSEFASFPSLQGDVGGQDRLDGGRLAGNQ